LLREKQGLSEQMMFGCRGVCRPSKQAGSEIDDEGNRLAQATNDLT
jgi:hypothetical protein